MEISKYLRARACPLCDSDDDSSVAYPARIDEQKLNDFAFASRKFPEFMHLRLVRCSNCGLLYSSPAFVPEFLLQAYSDASYDSDEEAQFAAKTYAGKLDGFLDEVGDRDVALEVGAGNGAFLTYLRRLGFREVIGIEPSQHAVAAAPDSVRPLIRLGMFQSADFEPASIGVFSCFQTIEHVENPRVLCSDAYRLLRPNGAIFLVGHDYESWVTRLLGERSPIFDIEHLQLFSKQSLRSLLTSCNFQDVQVGTIWNCYPLAYWIKLLPLPAAVKRPLIRGSKNVLIGKMPLRLNVGNIYAIGFKRSS